VSSDWLLPAKMTIWSILRCEPWASVRSREAMNGDGPGVLALNLDCIDALLQIASLIDHQRRTGSPR
jgi:hypothetical protein